MRGSPDAGGLDGVGEGAIARVGRDDRRQLVFCGDVRHASRMPRVALLLVACASLAVAVVALVSCGGTTTSAPADASLVAGDASLVDATSADVRSDGLPPCYSGGPSPTNGVCPGDACYICQEQDPVGCVPVLWCAVNIGGGSGIWCRPYAPIDVATCCTSCSPGFAIDGGACPPGATARCAGMPDRLGCPTCCYAGTPPSNRAGCLFYDAGGAD